MVEGGQTVAAIMLETVVGTNGILVPPDGYLAGVRELCDQQRDPADPRRGDGRLRPLRRVVRVPEVERATRPRLLRQGLEQRLRPDRRRRHRPARRRHVPRPRRSPAASPTRDTRWPAPRSSRASTSSRRKASSSTRGCSATDVIGPELEKIAGRHPSVGDVRGLGVFWAIELVRDQSDPRAAGAVQRRRRRREADGRGRRRLQGRRAVAVHPLQPRPRRPAVQHQRRRRPRAAWRSSTRRSPSPTATAGRAQPNLFHAPSVRQSELAVH